MWKWIVGRLRPEHPLAATLRTPGALRRFMAGLPHGSPEQALAAIAEVFEASPAPGFASARALQAFCQLDALAQRFRHALSARLLDHSPRQVLCEPVWHALSRSYSAAAHGYTQLLEALADAAGDDRLHGHIALASGRAMHAIAKDNMLQRMRYREAAPELWLRIERLFARGRARRHAEAVLVLYPDAPLETTFVREYLVALLFEMAPNSNLLPAQIHGVDLLLRAHAAHYAIRDGFERAVAPFVLDPNRDARPKRWPNGLPPWPGMRFFGLGEAYPRILAERSRVSRMRGIPAPIAPSQLSVARYRAMLDALCIHWALTPPRRRQLRRPAESEILVAHDFAVIRRLVESVALARSGRSLDHAGFRDQQVDAPVSQQDDAGSRAPGAPAAVAKEVLRNLEDLERTLGPGAIEPWRLTDTSPDGIGTVASGTAAWLKVGMLVAYREPDSALWQMAVVRRLSRGPDQVLRVGLRKLHGRPQCARVTINDPRLRSSDAEPAPALSYEAIQLVAAAERFLLLRPGVFDPAWRYTLSVGRRWDFIRMQRCIECGFDFEQIAYAITPVQQVA